MVSINTPVVIYWFRRDLRLHDNHGLFQALHKNQNVLPLFIFDTNILKQLDNPKDARVNFIFETILQLKHQLEEKGSTLLVRYGDPAEVIKNCTEEYRVRKIFANNDYETYGRERDEAINKFLRDCKIDFHLFKDHVIFEKNDILKPDGKPYTVYSYYMKHWKSVFQRQEHQFFPSEKYLSNLVKCDREPDPKIEMFGFRYFSYRFPSSKISSDIIRNYHFQRDIPSVKGTTRIGIHLRFGTVSIREIIDQASKWNEVFLDELIWREFFMQILYHFPYVEKRCFKARYENITWLNNEKEFELWCKGKTGYPLVDAGMNELYRTGFMHNRLRMITASFLVKHLLIDWRWGEAYFAQKLLDYELSSNNGGWQWAAGTGCDAVPYFRIFNPLLQAQKFDPKNIYIKKWIHDYRPDKYIKPLIDHNFARQRALNTFKAAVGNDENQY